MPIWATYAASLRGYSTQVLYNQLPSTTYLQAPHSYKHRVATWLLHGHTDLRLRTYAKLKGYPLDRLRGRAKHNLMDSSHKRLPVCLHLALAFVALSAQIEITRFTSIDLFRRKNLTSATRITAALLKGWDYIFLKDVAKIARPLLHGKPSSTHDLMGDLVSLSRSRWAWQTDDTCTKWRNLVFHVPLVRWPQQVVKVARLERVGIQRTIARLCSAAARLALVQLKQEDVIQ